MRTSNTAAESKHHSHCVGHFGSGDGRLLVIENQAAS
jgi:hypothetical protein